MLWWLRIYQTLWFSFKDPREFLIFCPLLFEYEGIKRAVLAWGLGMHIIVGVFVKACLALIRLPPSSPIPSPFGY
jgi:hypothetical protein